MLPPPTLPPSHPLMYHIHEYVRQVVNGLRERLYSVVNQEFSDSLYVDIDPNARSAWKSNDYWVVPWLHHGGYHASADTETEPRWMLQDPWRIA